MHVFHEFLGIDILKRYCDNIQIAEPMPKKKDGDSRDKCVEIYKTNIKIFFNEDEKDNAVSLARRIEQDNVAKITYECKDRIIMKLTQL